MSPLFGWILAAPAIPNDVGGRYVAGAYLVFVVLLLIYVGIMARKLARIERGLREVAEVAEQRREGGVDSAPAGRRGGEGPSTPESLARHESRGAGA